MDRYTEEYCTLDEVVEKIKKDGIAVVANVISAAKLKEYRKELWSMFGEMTKNLENPIKKDDQKSWRTIYDFFPLHSMLIQHWGIGHSKLAWDLRQEPKVIKTFSKLWNTKPDELLVSFDGVSFHLPPEATNRGWYRGNDWYHTDQSRMKKGLCCVQGMVTLYNIKDGDATFCYKEKSHLLHEQFFNDHDVKSRSDWYKLSEDELKFFKTCKDKRIRAKAGSLILWDSRLFHCGSEPLVERKQPNYRAVVYVCMTPRSFSDEKNMKKKIKAFDKKRTTSHWPHHVKIFPKKPNTYGKELKDIVNVEPVEFDDLSDLGKKLAGF